MSWDTAAASYGLLLAFAAVTQPIRGKRTAFVSAIAYAAAAVLIARGSQALWLELVAPGALLLLGYWLSGAFFRDPQPRLEAFLLRIDEAVHAERWMARVPRPLAEVFELGYLSVYVVVGGGALYTAAFGVEAVAYYWTLVLWAELASFAPLPWLRSRPPRAIALAGVAAPDAHHPRSQERVFFRRVNTVILNTASVQANTLPSGHVSGAVAAALGVMAVDAVVGWGLLVVAGIITVAAIAGRYHYVVDCAAGVVVAVAFWSVM